MARKLSDTQVVKVVVWNAVRPDHVIGTAAKGFKARFGFFYTMGQSASGKREMVEQDVKGVEVTAAWECRNSWPKDSYFEVQFTVKDMAAVRAQFDAQIASYGATPQEAWGEYKASYEANKE